MCLPPAESMTTESSWHWPGGPTVCGFDQVATTGSTGRALGEGLTGPDGAADGLVTGEGSPDGAGGVGDGGFADGEIAGLAEHAIVAKMRAVAEIARAVWPAIETREVGT